MSIGNNIKKWREIRNLKQSDLAELVGVSDKTVSSWEINGRKNMCCFEL